MLKLDKFLNVKNIFFGSAGDLVEINIAAINIKSQRKMSVYLKHDFKGFVFSGSFNSKAALIGGRRLFEGGACSDKYRTWFRCLCQISPLAKTDQLVKNAKSVTKPFRTQ